MAQHKQNHSDEHETMEKGSAGKEHDEGNHAGEQFQGSARQSDEGRLLGGAIKTEDLGPQLGTAALAAVGVALLDIELLPAVLIGAGAALAPKLLPGIGGLVRPLVKTAVRVGYGAVSKAQQVAAEATEQVRDMIAEVKAEGDTARRATPAGPSSSQTHSS